MNEVSGLSEWINECCNCIKAANNQNIKLVYTEHHTHRTLNKLKQGTEFRINVDVNQLMQNAAAHTNHEKNDPESDYQPQRTNFLRLISKGTIWVRLPRKYRMAIRSITNMMFLAT
ncbi:hypothetical protein [Pedobacter terrae]|uniref:hypothetical protein n=1 Tax=Pedobacter terrae TaxID=405671 RepID=UPI000B854D03|nr:hypothetical protein [Pedobacter terrae]